jgi:hypothetical protein
VLVTFWPGTKLTVLATVMIGLVVPVLATVLVTVVVMPLATPTDVMLNVQSGFDGQLGYTQAWPRRLTLPEVLANYKRTSDRKGKPYIPDAPFKWSDLLVILEKGMCSVGFCYRNSTDAGPLRYINYQY